MEEKQKSGEDVSLVQKCEVVVSSDGRIHALCVIGQIEGHFVLSDNQKATKYEHVIPLLVSLRNTSCN